MRRSSEYVDFSLAEMNVLLGTEITRDGHAIEVAERLDDAGILNGPHVEEQDECGEQDGGQRQSHGNQRQLSPAVVHAHRDERKESVREQSARNEPVFIFLN